MRKTVAEWLAEKKIVEKRINDTKDKLKNTQLFVADSNIRFNKEEANKQIEFGKSLLQKLEDLTSNKQKINRAIIQFNANTIINVDGIEYTIVEALEKYKNKENKFLYDLYYRNHKMLENTLNNLKNKQEEEVKDFERQITTDSKVSVSKQDERIIERRKQYEPTSVKVFDDFMTKMIEEENSLNSFLEKVHVKINEANYSNYLEIDFIEEK